MPSTDMLKKLLEEFAQKEAHTREEINVITSQIEELERRIVASQQKLESVGQDRAKVKTMMDRYTSGEWLSASPSAAAAALAAVAASPAAPITSKRKKKESAIEEPVLTAEMDQPKITLPSPRSSSTRLKALPDPTLPQPQPETQPSAAGSGLFRSEPQAEPAAAAVPEEPVRSNEQPFTFNNLFTSSPAAPEETPPPAPPSLPVAVPEEAAPVAAPPPVPQTPTESPLSSGNWPSLSTPSPASALSASSFFSDDDDDDMLSPQNAPVVDTTNTNPFLNISGHRETQTETGPQEAAAAPEADPAGAAANATQPAAAAQEEPPAQVADLDEDEGDDTVKSINDALRGLFR